MKNYREVVIGPYSAYQIAVKHGFEGTEEDWLKSVERDRLAAEAAAEKAKEYINADSTLTISGAPADAAVTGEKLNDRYTKAEIDDKFADIVSDKTLCVDGGFADAAATGVRIKMLEMTMGVDVNGIGFISAFDTLDGVELTGVWNKVASRVEF